MNYADFEKCPECQFCPVVRLVGGSGLCPTHLEKYLEIDGAVLNGVEALELLQKYLALQDEVNDLKQTIEYFLPDVHDVESI